MVMFTTIVHPEDGRELQVKFGRDMCDTYFIGDNVPFSIEKDYPNWANFADGVYESYSNKGEDDWVIVKGNKIVAVEKKAEENDENYHSQYDELYKKYNIKPLPKELWSEEAWKKHYEREKEREEKLDKFKKDNEINGPLDLDNPNDRVKACKLLCYPLMNMPGFSDIIKNNSLSELLDITEYEKPIIYYKDKK